VIAVGPPRAAAPEARPDGLVDDGRRWWFLGARLWMGVHPYAATSARAALAAYRRDIIDAEVSNGRSRREATEFVRVAELHVVDGPLSTPAAFDRELGWALGWALSDRTADISVPVGPATVEDCLARNMPAEMVERIRASVLLMFTSAG
jgi:hypothetical protein